MKSLTKKQLKNILKRTKKIHGYNISGLTKRQLLEIFKKHEKNIKLHGGGFFDSLKNIGSKIKDALTGDLGSTIRTFISRDPKTRPLFKGEQHAIRLSENDPYKYSSYNYMGPGTNVEGRLKRGDNGINEADDIAKQHDMDYYNMKYIRDPEERKRFEIMSDLNAIKRWLSSSDKTLPEVKLAIASITAKMWAQQAGKIPYGIYSNNPE